MQTVNITELRSHLPEYVARAEAGEEIMVSRRGEVVARLVAVQDRRAAAREQLKRLLTRAFRVAPAGA
ncbi:MAG: type II toxin-antitoxin system prevent-host-death family antitoxin [Thiohalocapsa sp.]